MLCLHLQCSCSFVADLWGKEVLEDTEVLDLEFYNEGLLLVKAESCEAAQSGCLVEHVQVSQSELLLYSLANFQQSLIFLLV